MMKPDPRNAEGLSDEEQWRISEEKFEAIFRNSPDAMSLSDLDTGLLLDVNEAFEKLTGYTRKESVGARTKDLGLWPDAAIRDRMVAELKANGSVRDIQAEFLNKLGGMRACLFSANIIKIRGVPHMLAAARDITDRKQAEADVRDSEERFRSFSQASFEGIVVTDKGRILDANDMMASITGYSQQELCGMDVSELVHPDDLDLVREKIRSGSDVPYEVRAVHKNGGIIYAQVCGKEIQFKGHACRISAIHDITEQRRTETALHDALQQIKTLNERIEAENVYLREEIRMSHPHGDIVGESKAINRVLMYAKQVAPTDSTVLILGETGTGKELVARAIHDMSPRKDKSLVVVNCAAMPQGLVERELFGNEKGAYTGATTTEIGRFEAADGGTMFLDEVGELPLETQAKLLRVLENGEFQRLGSTDTVSVDVRVIVATNRDLEKAVEDGSFRRDLFFRLNVFPITIPPLRDRREDIEPLVWSFVNEFGAGMGRKVEKISQVSFDSLMQYPWPGNVRELRNVIERAMISMDGTTLSVTAPAKVAGRASSNETLDEVQRRHILSILDRTGWRVRGKRGAALILQIAPSTLESRMAKLGIRRPGTNI